MLFSTLSWIDKHITDNWAISQKNEMLFYLGTPSAISAQSRELIQIILVYYYAITIIVNLLLSLGYSSMFRRFYVQKVLCSEGSMFRRSFVQKVLCLEGSMFRRFYIQKLLCSEGPMFRNICSEGSMFRKYGWLYVSYNWANDVESTSMTLIQCRKTFV